MPRLPDFLVVGAMKSGTTSMFRDLSANPALHLAEKEANHLLSDQVLTTAGRAAYGQEFRRAGTDQVCGEVSSAYSKLPDYPGVVGRAHELCGDDVKVLYLVREPLARTLSHHYHDVAAGLMEPDFEVAVRRHSNLLDFSRYAMQIQPWLEVFGSGKVKVIQFERFIAHRREVADEVARFLGVEGHADRVESERVFNRSEGKPAPRGAIWKWSRGVAYQRWVRPLLPTSVRERLVRRLFPVAPPRPAPPTADTVDWLLEELSDDSRRLAEMIGLDAPFWDFEQTRERFASVPREE